MLNPFIDYLLLEKKYSPHTVNAYKKDIEVFQEYLNENFQDNINEANYSQIRSWIISLVEKGISNRSVNRKVSSLNSYYKFLMKIEEIDKNPLAKHKALKVSKKVS